MSEVALSTRYERTVQGARLTNMECGEIRPTQKAGQIIGNHAQHLAALALLSVYWPAWG